MQDKELQKCENGRYLKEWKEADGIHKTNHNILYAKNFSLSVSAETC